MSRKLLAALMLLCSMPLGAVAAPTIPGSAGDVSGTLIVKLKASAREGALLTNLERDARRHRLSRLASSAGYTSTMPWRGMGKQVATMRLPTKVKPEVAQALMSRIMATGEVEWVDRGGREKLLSSVSPNDSFFQDASTAGQWWLREAAGGNADNKSVRQRGAPNINVAWETTVGAGQASSVVVAVLDTGYTDHIDLDPSRKLPGYDFVSESPFDNDSSPGRDSDPTDPGDAVDGVQAATSAYKQSKCAAHANNWHGLAVTGVLAARTNNAEGLAAVNWNTRILPVRVAGQCGADMEDILDAIRWAAGLPVANVPVNQNPAKVINISFGGDTPCGPAYQHVINEVRALGVVVVAAAGNEHATVSRPANCSGVIAVGALNREGFKSSYSNFGPEVTVSTVGGDAPSAGAAWNGLGDASILSLYNTSEQGASSTGTSWYAYYAGTSFSSPIVAGIVSLMLDANPALTPAQIEEGLRLSSRPHVRSNRIGVCSNQNPGRCICTETTCGKGIVDAAEAVRYAAALAASTPFVPLTLLAQNIDASEVSAALAVASQDRPANAVVSNSQSSGGGGGSTDMLTVLAAGMLASWLLIARGSRWASRRANHKALAGR